MRLVSAALQKTPSKKVRGFFVRGENCQAIGATI